MRVELVVIGGSWGGVAAAAEVLAALPEDFGAAILAVFHRQVGGDEGLLGRALERHSPLPVCDADDKDEVRPGRVLVAPAGYHLLVEQRTVALSTEGAVNFSRPSIDVTFDTAVASFGGRMAGVILTGANADGAEGMAKLRRAGGKTLVQDPETAERREMPEAVLAATEVDVVGAPHELGTALVKMTR